MPPSLLMKLNLVYPTPDRLVQKELSPRFAALIKRILYSKKYAFSTPSTTTAFGPSATHSPHRSARQVLWHTHPCVQFCTHSSFVLDSLAQEISIVNSRFFPKIPHSHFDNNLEKLSQNFRVDIFPSKVHLLFFCTILLFRQTTPFLYFCALFTNFYFF